jgi:formylglycine-generating enzyme required for sulfatase activity
MDDNTAEPFQPDTPLLLPGGVPLGLVRIPAGPFRMGQRGWEPHEEPVHEVTIAHEFWLGATPVTQAQYRAMAEVCRAELAAIDGNRGESPSYFTGDDHPVERVSWDDARCVCRGLTRWLQAAGRLPEDWRVDLPTEAQWEHACRAQTDTIYATGDGEADLARTGWYIGNAGDRTHPVKEKEANGWELFDMHGNVWEWCLDYYDPHSYRRRVEGAPGEPLVAREVMEFDEADPELVAIAEMLERFAAGRREVRSGDRNALERYRNIAERRVENGEAQWTDDIGAVRFAQRESAWPGSAEARRLAAGTLPVFRQAIEAAVNREDPAQVLRGGVWGDAAAYCRSSCRLRNALRRQLRRPRLRRTPFHHRPAVTPHHGGLPAGLRPGFGQLGTGTDLDDGCPEVPRRAGYGLGDLSGEVFSMMKQVELACLQAKDGK